MLLQHYSKNHQYFIKSKNPFWAHSNLFKPWKLITFFFKKKKSIVRLKVVMFSCQKSAEYSMNHSLENVWINGQIDWWQFIERGCSKHFELQQFWYMEHSPCKIGDFCSKILIFMSVIDDNTHPSVPRLQIGKWPSDMEVTCRYTE